MRFQHVAQVFVFFGLKQSVFELLFQILWYFFSPELCGGLRVRIEVVEHDNSNLLALLFGDVLIDFSNCTPLFL